MPINPLFLIDFYKVGHVAQYPADTTQVWSNFTPRSSRVPGQNTVVHFGLRYFLSRLKQQFDQGFFYYPIGSLLREYKDLIRSTLGVSNPATRHIEELHDLGYLPLRWYAVPEGFSVPLNCPMQVVTNTHSSAFWLPNYLETILSNVMWKPCTSATTAQRYRRVFQKWAEAANETDFSFIDWQGHDFSFRGMSGLEDAVLSGMGHLLSFSGTDTIPALLAAAEYYDANVACGGSVPATEHSVMCAGEECNEFDTFKRLLTEVYPEGIVSIVSDTWDLWRVLTDCVPRLREEILARNGKLVIRPDSGNPEMIICGDPDMIGQPHCYWRPDGDALDRMHPAALGTLQLLANELGAIDRHPALPLIRNAGAIYGDSITVEVAENILRRIVTELKLSPYNMVFGIGSFTYEHVTRDTYGFAMKATAVRRGGKVVDIFKNPVTDNGGKKSHRGIPAVYRTDDSTEDHPNYFVLQGATEEQLDNCGFQKVFEDGKLLVFDSFEAIRKRVRTA